MAQLFETIVLRFGAMQVLQHDQEGEFCNELVEELCRWLGIKKARCELLIRLNESVVLYNCLF